MILSKKVVLDAINKVLRIADLQLIRHGRKPQDFIPFHKTLLAAENAGLSVGDYIDNSFNVPGSTQLTIDRMRELGIFDEKIGRVCEIGTGSGCYLEKTINACLPIITKSTKLLQSGGIG